MTSILGTSHPPRRRPPARIRGFTLVELALALAVLGILATIALPGFMGPVRKARRFDAVEAMALVQQAQESWRAGSACYAARLGPATSGTASTSCSPDSSLALPASSRGRYYLLEVSGASAVGYTLTARAVNGLSQASDSGCTTLSVTVRNGIGVHEPPDCWSR